MRKKNEDGKITTISSALVFLLSRRGGPFPQLIQKHLQIPCHLFCVIFTLWAFFCFTWNEVVDNFFYKGSGARDNEKTTLVKIAGDNTI